MYYLTKKWCHGDRKNNIQVWIANADAWDIRWEDSHNQLHHDCGPTKWMPTVPVVTHTVGQAFWSLGLCLGWLTRLGMPILICDSDPPPWRTLTGHWGFRHCRCAEPLQSFQRSRPPKAAAAWAGNWAGVLTTFTNPTRWNRST